MADYNIRLSQFHQRIWQDELRLSASIDESGNVHVKHPDLRELKINLSEYSPEIMSVGCMVFEDHDAPPHVARAHEDLILVCNSVNLQESAKLWVLAPYSAVFATFELVLAAPRRMPDEALLRGVIGRVLSEIMNATKEFAAELLKFTAAQKTVNDHLSSVYRPAVTADSLFESYTSSPAFAADQRLALSAVVDFPTASYARQRCYQMCTASGGPSGDI